MFNFLITFFITILVVLTLFIGVKQPKMHNKIQIYDSSYITTIDYVDKTDEKPITKEVKELPSKEVAKKEVVVSKKENEPKVKKEVSKVQNTNKKENKKTSQTTNNEVKKEKIEENKKEISKVQNQTTTKKETNEVQENLTQEELIAWNTWHSNIQNSLMRDVKMPYIPSGIVFKFSFTVDKYGKITNINTYSTTSKYTPYAIEYIAPVIRSYQGKSILDFPKDSKRITTFFSGGWKMSSGQSVYSKPSNYNDVEKIIK